MFLDANKPFAGDKKVGMSLFGPWEKRLVEKYVSKIPKKIEHRFKVV